MFILYIYHWKRLFNCPSYSIIFISSSTTQMYPSSLYIYLGLMVSPITSPKSPSNPSGKRMLNGFVLMNQWFLFLLVLLCSITTELLVPGVSTLSRALSFSIKYRGIICRAELPLSIVTGSL